jgi:hypothetical protein
MAAHPGITAEDAMTIIVNQYLREETFHYKDETTNDQFKDGGQWYFIEIQQLLEKELLQADQLNSLQFDSEEVALPLGPGLCYTGKGIQFEYEGKRYLTSEANKAVLTEALKSGSAKWYWNKTLSKKCGGKDAATFNAYIVDKSGKRFPDLHLEISKRINIQ